MSPCLYTYQLLFLLLDQGLNCCSWEPMPLQMAACCAGCACPRRQVSNVLLDAAGLMGGHSGLNINEDRGNAVRFVAQVTNAVLKAAPNARLARISGGDKRNAIAREASAQIVVGPPCTTSEAAFLVFWVPILDKVASALLLISSTQSAA